MDTLFDDKGIFNLNDIIANHPSFKKIMEDDVVTDEELCEQANITLSSLQRLQAICNKEQQSAIMESISEMSVLFAVYHIYELQKLYH